MITLVSKVDHEWKLFKIGLASFINGFCKMNVEYMSSMTSLGMIQGVSFEKWKFQMAVTL